MTLRFYNLSFVFWYPQVFQESRQRRRLGPPAFVVWLIDPVDQWLESSRSCGSQDLNGSWNFLLSHLIRLRVVVVIDLTLSWVLTPSTISTIWRRNPRGNKTMATVAFYLSLPPRWCVASIKLISTCHATTLTSIPHLFTTNRTNRIELVLQ